jgi:CRP-like cAMP-binding protein
MVSIDLLKNFKLFERFSDEELKKFSDLSTKEFYKAGVQLWKKGEPATRLLLLEEGKVIMTLDIDSGPHRPPMQVTVDIAAKGQGLGWSSVVEPYVYTRSVRCLDDSTIIVFDGLKLRELLDSDKALGYKFMQSIARLLRNRLSHIEIILIGERGLSMLTEM